jgi:hypothetical protein
MRSRVESVGNKYWEDLADNGGVIDDIENKEEMTDVARRRYAIRLVGHLTTKHYFMYQTRPWDMGKLSSNLRTRTTQKY